MSHGFLGQRSIGGKRGLSPITYAQEIYLAAFNNAWEQYRDPEDRRGKAPREEVAHKVAWAAVKQQYEKKDDKWKRKKELLSYDYRDLCVCQGVRVLETSPRMKSSTLTP